MSRAWRETGFAACLLAPTALGLGVFVFYPALSSFRLSLNDVDAFSMRTTYIGLDNYRMLLLSPAYWQSLGVTLAFTALTVIPEVCAALAIALGLDANPYFRNFLRTVFLAPVAVSSAMAAMLWIFFYNPSSGYLNYLLELLHLTGPNWLGDVHWALVAVAITTVWKELGFSVVFLLAGLSAIPNDVREASALDGAGRFQRFRYVILPMLTPTLLFVTVVSMITSFQSFGQIHILTEGGPAGATNTLVYNLYKDAFENFQTGSASAQAVILFAVMLAATAIQFWIARRRISEAS